MISALNQKKGADLMTAPSVVTRSELRAKIEIIRGLSTEYDPPEIPQSSLVVEFKEVEVLVALVEV